MKAVRLTFDGDTFTGKAAFARIYDGLLTGWPERKASAIRQLLKLVDTLQSISNLREYPPEALEKARAQCAAQGVEYEPNEHDRVLKPGVQTALLSESDFASLKNAFYRVETWPPQVARSVEAALRVLEAVETVDVKES